MLRSRVLGTLIRAGKYLSQHRAIRINRVFLGNVFELHTANKMRFCRQASIEGKLDKKRKNLLGAPAGKKVNQPPLDPYMVFPFSSFSSD